VTYLWSKGVGAGALALALVAYLVGLDAGAVGKGVAPALGLFGAATTGALLVWDLKRPGRFLYIFLKPNRRSWLVLGAYVLTVFSGGAILWALAAAFDVGWAMSTLAWLGIPVSALMAGYTAFLFGQAEGRDLWQSPLLFWHLVVQAVMVGSGALAVAGIVAGLSDAVWQLLAVAFVLSAGVHLLMLGLEYAGTHASRQASVAAHIVARGRYSSLFWFGAVLPVAIAMVLGALTWAGMDALPLAIAGIVVQPALLAYESVFIRAGQDPPLS
jgi:predicted membrane protein